MEIRELELGQAEAIYREYLVNDFPPAEVKPMDRIAQLWEKGIYGALGIYEGDVLEGYAFFVRPKESAYILLDYFAVLSSIRGRGTGSKFVKLLREGLKPKEGILIEVENPDFAQNQEELALRERRIAFYIRNGFVMTQTAAKAFGVEYKVMALDEPSSAGQKEEREELYRRELEKNYRTMFPPKLYEKGVCIH